MTMSGKSCFSSITTSLTFRPCSWFICIK
jgi:hypothetical protein